MNATVASVEPKKVVRVGILNLDELGYGPQGKHTRRAWRAECLENLQAGKEQFEVWQHSWIEKIDKKLPYASHAVNFEYDDGSHKTIFGNQLENSEPYSLDFVAHTFEHSVQAFQFKFKEKADFSYATFTRDAHFRGATFARSADFNSTTFKVDVYFSRVTFPNVDFRSTTFAGKAEFASATFTEDVKFFNSTFTGKVDFRSTTFKGNAYFSKATFEGNADFSKVTFVWNADFSSAMFKLHADFSKASFTYNANFNSAVFAGDADFRCTTFTGNSDFSSVKFSGYADFSSEKFSGKADFRNAMFAWNANFSIATFIGEADFNNVKFTGKVDFNSVMFTGKVDFSSVMFTENADFNSVMFSENADFSIATFTGDAYFSSTIFNHRAVFFKSKFTSQCRFDNKQDKKTTDWTKETQFFGAVNFENTEIANVGHFERVRFNGEIPNFLGVDNSKTLLIFSGDAYFTKKDISEDAVKRLAQLKRLADEQGQTDQALIFNAFELNAKRAQAREKMKHLTWKQKANNSDYWFANATAGFRIFSDYGRSFFEPLKWYLALLGVTFYLAIAHAVYFTNKECPNEYANVFSYLWRDQIQCAPVKPKDNETPIVLSGWRAAVEYTSYRASGILDFADSDKQTIAISNRLFNQPIEPPWMRAWGIFKGIASIALLFLAALGLRNKYRIK